MFPVTSQGPCRAWDSGSVMGANGAVALSVFSVLPLIGVGQTFPTEVDRGGTPIDHIWCALKSQTNVYQFHHNDKIVVEIDKNGCNIEDKQKKRCDVIELHDYKCILIKNLQKADIGSFKLEISGSDGVIHKMLLLNITEDGLNDLRNACHFKTTFTHLSNRIYCGKAETELSDDLRRARNNGIKIFSAIWLPDCNPPTEKSMNVPPKGTDAPPTRELDIRILIYCVAVVLGLVIAVICCTR